MQGEQVKLMGHTLFAAWSKYDKISEKLCRKVLCAGVDKQHTVNKRKAETFNQEIQHENNEAGSKDERKKESCEKRKRGTAWIKEWIIRR